MKRFKAATMDKTSPLKMKCQVKSKFDFKKNKNKRQKAVTNTLPKFKRKEMSTVSTCLILPVLAQLYPVSWYFAGQTTEAFSASDHPDTGSQSKLYWQPSSAMQILPHEQAHHEHSPYTCIPCHYPKGPWHTRSLCLTLPPLSDEKGPGLKQIG